MLKFTLMLSGVGVVSEFHRAPLHGLHFGQFHRLGMWPRRQYLPRPQVIGHQDVARNGSRPIRLREYFGSGMMATLAFTSDVPPRPDPLITEIS